MSGLKSHMASDKRKWAFVFTAIFLVIVFLVVMVWSNFFTEWNKYCWGILGGHNYDEAGICVRCGAEKLDEVETDKQEPEDPEDEEPAEQAPASGMVANVSSELGVRLLVAPMAASEAVSPVEAAKSYVLTATVTPSYADNKEVDWAIRWKNAESEWATGKDVTEHCTITPESDGALKATLTNLKDFGEQIEVVVTSRDNPEKQAICLVDYVQKITGFTFNMPDISSETTAFTYEIETSDYTIAADISFSVSDTLELDKRDFRYSLEGDLDHLGVIYGVYDAKLTCNRDAKTITIARDSSKFDPNAVTIPGLPNYFISVTQSELDDYRATVGDLISIFRDAIKSQGYDAYFTITYKATYNGVDYSSGFEQIKVNFDGSSLYIPVEDITMSTGNVLF